jgi:hypothetical protein
VFYPKHIQKLHLLTELQSHPALNRKVQTAQKQPGLVPSNTNQAFSSTKPGHQFMKETQQEATTTTYNERNPPVSVLLD